MLNDIPDWIEILFSIATLGGVAFCIRQLHIAANVTVSGDKTTSDSRISAGRDIYMTGAGGLSSLKPEIERSADDE